MGLAHKLTIKFWTSSSLHTCLPCIIEIGTSQRSVSSHVYYFILRSWTCSVIFTVIIPFGKWGIYKFIAFTFWTRVIYGRVCWANYLIYFIWEDIRRTSTPLPPINTRSLDTPFLPFSIICCNYPPSASSPLIQPSSKKQPEFLRGSQSVLPALLFPSPSLSFQLCLSSPFLLATCHLATVSAMLLGSESSLAAVPQ